MTLICDIADFAAITKQVLDDKAAALGINAVFYGDQSRIPTTPVACVEPNTETSLLKGSGVTRATQVNLSCFVLLYGSIIQSGQINRAEVDQLAKEVKKVLNSDPKLQLADGIERVIHCYVTSVQSGYTNKGNTVMQSARIEFEALSQELLPS